MEVETSQTRMMMADGRLIGVGSGMAFLAVMLGAFGTHGLRNNISAQNLQIWETGTHYHLIHAVAAVLAGLLSAHVPGRGASRAGWFFIGGCVVFGGSLYVLAVTNIRWMGAITPLGGLMFLIGWAMLAWAAIKSTP